MSHRSLALIVAVALVATLTLPVYAALPAYMAKPATWTSKLATNAGPFVTDAQFAQWVKNAQGNPPRFSFLSAFHQCYGGGFLGELASKGVLKFGANSASRYFEAASYNTNNSYFTFAWGWRAINPMNSTDLNITDDAFAFTRDGINPPMMPPVPDNPFAAWENAQYLSDPAVAAPPERLAAAQRNYAILFAGQPDARDRADLDQLYNVLTVNYGYARADILIVYGNGLAPGGGVVWMPDRPGNAADLQWAFTNWLPAKLNAQMPNQTAQVFFWAGDHGSADYPILISVENNSRGVAGSAVNNRFLGGQPTGPIVYEAGGGTNREIWDVVGGDVDAIAFSEVSVPAWFQSQGGGWVYFSVDRMSAGAANSDVNRELAAGRSAGSDVFMMTPNSNRLAFDGRDSLGLLELPAGNDELDALSLRNIQSVLDPVTKLPNRPFFFSFLGSSQVFVFDPMAGGYYLYYDFLWGFANAPWELDALALWDDGARINNFLYFDPRNDRMLFSVGRQENAFPWNAVNACDVLKLGPDGMGGALLTQWRFCNQLGLLPGMDNLDALDLGIGANGQPIESPYPYPPPSYPPYPPYPSPMPPSPQPSPDPGYQPPGPSIVIAEPPIDPVPAEDPVAKLPPKP